MKKILFSLLFLMNLSAKEIDLAYYERTIYSQNGEDGVIAQLFQLINPSSRFCVDFGAYDGVAGSNTYLLRLQDWDSLLMDRLYEVPEFKVHKEFITAENINRLFDKYKVPVDMDLLSIDIDYNDFHVWKAIDNKYRPAVVVIEYNASLGPDDDKVVKYRPFFCGGGDNYFGASILALYNLGRHKGYSLVYAEKSGTNLFFVRDDIIEDLHLEFKNMNCVEKLYRPPAYGEVPGAGHGDNPKKQVFFSSKDFLP